jgi:deoxycytidine triphosphate deaminase
VILSDRSIREEVAAGRIVIEPFDDTCVQPSSVDLHIDRYFRVFRNHTMGHIDVKQRQEELTELVQITEGDVFMLHPGEFVLGSTLERVALPDDLVARLEGKSSLGRLGLLIHSSLPASETVLIADESGVRLLTIGEIVSKRVEGSIVGFDPATLEVGYHAITGWYEGPADRIFEVRLESGRRVRVTAGHNLFTLDRDGHLAKVRTGELLPGTAVAVPRQLPEGSSASSSGSLGSAGSAGSSGSSGSSGSGSSKQTALTDGAGLASGAAASVALLTAPPLDTVLSWEAVAEVVDTGVSETIYDIEVRPGGRKIENFVAGSGGIFVSNTAGFVDAGFDGHLTLELSNVANLPITLYPGMKIGQISFLKMTTPADNPYGSKQAGSKYQGQRGPTPSRYFENFSD